MIQLTIWGPITKDENRKLSDLTGRELAALIPLCILMLWIGVAPDSFLQPSREALEGVLSDYRGRLAEPVVAQPALRVTQTVEAGR